MNQAFTFKFGYLTIVFATLILSRCIAISYEIPASKIIFFLWLFFIGILLIFLSHIDPNKKVKEKSVFYHILCFLLNITFIAPILMIIQDFIEVYVDDKKEKAVEKTH